MILRCTSLRLEEEGGRVGSIVDTLRIRSLKKLVAASRMYSDALARQFEKARTTEEKSKIAGDHAKALKRTHAFQFRLEQQETKAGNK